MRSLVRLKSLRRVVLGISRDRTHPAVAAMTSPVVTPRRKHYITRKRKITSIASENRTFVPTVSVFLQGVLPCRQRVSTNKLDVRRHAIAPSLLGTDIHGSVRMPHQGQCRIGTFRIARDTNTERYLDGGAAVRSYNT